MEELIRHTRTSYAGLAMSNKESWRGSERNAGWMNLGDVSEYLKKVVIRETKSITSHALIISISG